MRKAAGAKKCKAKKLKKAVKVVKKFVFGKPVDPIKFFNALLVLLSGKFGTFKKEWLHLLTSTAVGGRHANVLAGEVSDLTVKMEIPADTEAAEDQDTEAALNSATSIDAINNDAGMKAAFPANNVKSASIDTSESSDDDDGMSSGAIAAIVIGILAVFGGIGAFVVMNGQKKKTAFGNTSHEQFGGTAMQTEYEAQGKDTGARQGSGAPVNMKSDLATL